MLKYVHAHATDNVEVVSKITIILYYCILYYTVLFYSILLCKDESYLKRETEI